MAFVYFLQKRTVDAHSVEVRSCLSFEGKIRIFVEHWHSDLTDPSEGGTMRIRDETYSASGPYSSLYPVGMINNAPDRNSLEGCSSGVSEIAKTCNTKAYNDWVYFEFPTICEVEVSYKFLKGDTVYLKDGCDSLPLLPLSIQATFQDLSAPIPYLNDEVCKDMGIVMHAETATPEELSTVVTYDISASDDCDPEPSVTASIPSGSLFSVGNTEVTITAIDNKSRQGSCTFTVSVGVGSSAPSDSPSDNPSSRPSSTPSMHPSFIPTVSPSMNPSVEPSTSMPTTLPSAQPTFEPSVTGSSRPSVTQSQYPTTKPSLSPTTSPPSLSPTSLPTGFPTNVPSMVPTALPSNSPSTNPSQMPSAIPSTEPTDTPYFSPSSSPSVIPSSYPSHDPSPLPSSIPTLVPSIEPTVTCEEYSDDMFALEYKKEDGVVVGVKERTCGFLSKKDEERRAELCGNDISFGGVQSAFNTCVISCGRCIIVPTLVPSEMPIPIPSVSPSISPIAFPSVSPIIFPSVSPTEEPSFHPSAGPTQERSYEPTITWACEEDPNAEFGWKFITTRKKKKKKKKKRATKITGVETRTCEFLRTKDQSKREEICASDVVFGDVKKAWDVCVITCRRCETEEPTDFPSTESSLFPTTLSSSRPSTEPSFDPSFSPSNSPTVVASISPSKSRFPSTSPSVTPTLNPSNSPSFSPTKSPSHQPSDVPSVVPTIACRDYPDEFGASGKLTCAQIRKWKTQKRDRKCSKGKIQDFCRITCGVCCLDNPEYTFEYKNRIRDCEWLRTENKAKKIVKICEEIKGKNIQYGCIETCGFCYSQPELSISPTPTIV